MCLRGENHGSGKKKFLWRAVAVFGIIMMDCQEGAIVRMIRAVAFDMDDGDIKETIRPYIMGRIVDIEKFFSHYHCDPLEKNVCISFEITDHVLDWNNRTFNILFNEGNCSLTEQKADCHVAMSIATLTTLLLGYKTVLQLYRTERIQGDEHSVQRLDDVILHETPYISDYI